MLLFLANRVHTKRCVCSSVFVSIIYICVYSIMRDVLLGTLCTHPWRTVSARAVLSCYVLHATCCVTKDDMNLNTRISDQAPQYAKVSNNGNWYAHLLNSNL